VTDIEFDIIDELYFVISYAELQDKLSSYSDDALKGALHLLLQRGWIKCYHKPDDEAYDAGDNFNLHYRDYLYLATKEGLKAHNTV
jgi:hypothetical protein